MGKIVGEISRLYQLGRFSEKPRGPLGSYIEVIDEKHRNAVESQIGSLLTAFVVSNKEDKFVLMEIFERFANKSSPIITTKFMKEVS